MDKERISLIPNLAVHGPLAEPVVKEGRGKKKKEEKKEKPRKRSERGVETMFRTSYRMHVEMSGLADSKANIMISINGIIISVILAAISPKIASNPWLLLPTTVLLLGCLASLTFAIVAARPRVTRRKGSENSGASLMFFGSFVSMSEAEYEREVDELTYDSERLFRSMARDLYGLGSVLERKFRLLRTAYTIFIAGLALGVTLYIGVYLSMVLGGPGAPLG